MVAERKGNTRVGAIYLPGATSGRVGARAVTPTGDVVPFKVGDGAVAVSASSPSGRAVFNFVDEAEADRIADEQLQEAIAAENAARR